MIAVLLDGRPARRRAALRGLQIALAVSLIVHAIALWEWMPRLSPFSPEAGDVRDNVPPLSVLVLPPASPPKPAPSAPASPPPPPPPTPKPRPTPPLVRPPTPPVLTAPPRETAPVIAAAPAPPVPSPAPPVPVAPPEPAPAPPRATAPPAPPTDQYADLSSYIASRRRARGESADGSSRTGDAVAADDAARRERALAANLASLNERPRGAEQRESGGVFQITELGYDYATFSFYGWHRESRRRMPQNIEVRRGGESDIRIAVVRKMISIIREHEQADFTWRSHRLSRAVTLSARSQDQASLESFLLTEFFEATRGAGPR